MSVEDIENRYVLDEPFSYGGKYRLYDKFGKNNKNIIEKSLRASDVYSRFLQYKKPRRYSPVYVDNKRELFQSDLIAFTNKELADKNDGYLYLFTTIDVFSKYAWVYKLKNKECKTVMNCFADILSKCGKKPAKIQTDRGSEFVCKKFKKFFKENDIHHYVSYSDRKCPVIERFNLTIQQLLYKIMDHENTDRWVDCISKAMKIYLNRTHRTICMSPNEAELKKNEKMVRRNLYKYFSKVGIKPQKIKFKIGDTVRVWKYHRQFQRGYDSKFTHEYFKISKILKNLPVVRYKLKDINGEDIIGSYFQEELVHYTEPEFHKTIILDTKGKGINKMYLVKYEGWDDKYNRWVKAEDTIDLQNTEDENRERLETDENTNNITVENNGSTEGDSKNREVSNNSFYDDFLSPEIDKDQSENDNEQLRKNSEIDDSHIEKLPGILKVNVVSDNDVVNFLELSRKRKHNEPNNVQAGKKVKVFSADDQIIGKIVDTNLNSTRKGNSTSTKKSTKYQNRGKNNFSDLENVFRSSTRRRN